ncbi:MAG: hypothetical protein JEY99_04505 [Spirochaetales bacterium]|nr:hypothetical protein [Spirochaetales bacterium]
MQNKVRVIFNYLKYRNTTRFKSVKAVRSHQKRGLRKLLRHLKSKSPYYKNYLKNGGFQSLPIMEKQTMMEHFDELVCVAITKEEAFRMAIDSEKSRDFSGRMKGMTVGLSSGTSNHRGLFLASRKEADIWTGTILGRVLPKISGHQEIAFFLRANSTLYENVRTKKIGFIYYDIYQPMREHIRTLNETQPNVLIAPPSVLMILADAVASGDLKVKLDKVVSVAEVLEDKDRDYFKEQFSRDVIFQVYQCTEGFLGYTCEYGTLHLNEDIVMIEEEPIDDHRFIPIITDFTRRSQPIVRYRLNDVLVHKSTACPCGTPFMALEKIEGREDDVFLFEGKGGGDVKLFPDIIRRGILYVAGIRNYQVIQTDKNNVTLLLEYDSNMDINEIQKSLTEEFHRVFEQFQIVAPRLSFGDYIHRIDKKMKRVIHL